MEVLKSIDDINKVLELSKEEPVFIYKHSVTCPYNAMAQKQVVALKHDYPIYAVVVQHARNVSNEIAKRLEVTHQTPQIILLQDAEVKAELSHGAITADAMLALLDNLSENSVAAEGVA